MLVSNKCLFVFLAFIVFSVDSKNQQSFGLEAVQSITRLLARDTPKQLSASLNLYLDEVVTGLNAYIDCPIKLPVYNVSVNTDILVVPIFGNLEFYNGELKEISTITRSGDAKATYIDESLTINMALEVKNIKFAGDFLAKFEDLGPSGSTTGTIETLKVQAQLIVDLKTFKATLRTFFMEAGSVDLQVKVLPILDWFIDGIVKTLVYVIKWPLLSMISGQVKTSIQQFLDGYTDLFQIN